MTVQSQHLTAYRYGHMTSGGAARSHTAHRGLATLCELKFDGVVHMGTVTEEVFNGGTVITLSYLKTSVF